MIFKNSYIAFVLFIALSSCNNIDNQTIVVGINKFSDPVIVQIHEYKDQRQTDSLLLLLASTNRKYQDEAAFALASVGDSNAINVLNMAFLKITGNNDADIYSQKCIALALLQSSGHLGFKAMTLLYEKSVDDQVREKVLALIGKCASKNEKVFQFLVKDLAVKKESKSYKMGLITAFYEFCTRQYFSSEMLEIALNFAKGNESFELRQMAASYLARLNRIKDPKLSDAFTNSSKQLSKTLGQLIEAERDPLVKMNLVLALGNFEEATKTSLLKSQLLVANDYRVTVNLFNAASTFDYDSLKEIGSNFIGHENSHIEIAAANFFLRNGQGESIDFYKNLLNKQVFWRTKNILLSCLLQKDNNNIHKELEAFVTKHLLSPQNEFDISEMYQMLASHQEWAAILFEFYQKESSETAKTYCLDALGKMAVNYVYTNHSKTVPRIKTLLVNAIAANNGFRVYTGALYLQNKVFQFTETDSLLSVVQQSFSKWFIPKYFETRLELEKLALKLSEEPFEDFSLKNPYNNPIDWEYVRKMPKDQKMKISTNKGEIIIKLAVEDAPETVSYIAKLVASGFYNKLIWHRVLSNFVVQGGDPEGNGTGGSDASLRTEHSFNTYTEGAVGMASAGKDTESCQFFICHNATPNLNGRYTIIGYVVEGMNVVHQIQVNDKILKIELIP